MLMKTRFFLVKSSVTKQKGESQNECYKKAKHATFSNKQTILTPWYACAYSPFYLIADEMSPFSLLMGKYRQIKVCLYE